MGHELTEPAQVFRALGDPIRLDIVRQIAAASELPCRVLEETLPVSKATISYHTRMLRHAGIIDVHKRGRNFFYSLRGETLGELADMLHALSPVPPAADGASAPAPLASVSDDDSRPAPLLTW